MSRSPLPLQCGDISMFARSLSGQLAQCGHPPGHMELLNMLARAAGFRNFQHLRAQSARGEPCPPPAPPAPEPVPVDESRVKRLCRLFDSEGRLTRWPGKLGQQQSCLWVIWSKLPAGHVLSEVEVNQHLNAAHLFGDYALLRRCLCDYGMMTRTRDGREYRRLEQHPPPDGLALIRQVSGRKTLVESLRGAA